LWFRQDG